MTDIVERLRKTADHEWIGHKTWTMAALREAADEIERLRTALIAIIDNYDDLNVPRIEVIEDARNLLNVSH
jgi:hypothetical protein